MPGAEGIDVVAWARQHGQAHRPCSCSRRAMRRPTGSAASTRARTTISSSPSISASCSLGSARSSAGPRGVDAPVLERGRLRLDPVRRVVEVEGREAEPDLDRIPHPRAADAPLAGRRRPQADRRARLGRRDGSAGLQRHRCADEPAARQAADRGRPHRHRPRRRLPAGGRREHRPAGRCVRRQSIRVALASTALVGVAYLLVAVAVVAFATRDLTAQVDTRLDRSARPWPTAAGSPAAGSARAAAAAPAGGPAPSERPSSSGRSLPTAASSTNSGHARRYPPRYQPSPRRPRPTIARHRRPPRGRATSAART